MNNLIFSLKILTSNQINLQRILQKLWEELKGQLSYYSSKRCPWLHIEYQKAK